MHVRHRPAAGHHLLVDEDEELLVELDALEDRAWYEVGAFHNVVEVDPAGAVGHLTSAVESVLAMAVKSHLPKTMWPKRPTLGDYVDLAQKAGWLDEPVVRRIGILTAARNSVLHPERWARERVHPTGESRAVRASTFHDLYGTMADTCSQLYAALGAAAPEREGGPV